MYRTVELTVRAKDLNEVLEKLKISEDFKENVAFTLTVDMKDEKGSYEYLCKSDKIIDWKLVEQQSEAAPIGNNNPCCSGGCNCSKEEEKPDPIKDTIDKVSEQLEQGRAVKCITELLPDCDFEDISNILVGTWMKKREKGSDLKFSALFFRNFVIPYVISRRTEKDNTIVGTKLFVETYYKNSNPIMEEVIADVVGKIKKNWNELEKFDSFPSLIGTLFGPSKEIRDILGL